MTPHHRTAAQAEVEAQRLADLTGACWLVWQARRIAGPASASACFTVTAGDYTFPSACGLAIASKAYPRKAQEGQTP